VGDKMQKDSRLIISEYGGGKVLYCGEGDLKSWKDKLGHEPRNQVYNLTEISKKFGENGVLEIRNQTVIKSLRSDGYEAPGFSKTTMRLSRETRDLLIGLLNESDSEQEGR